MGDRQGLIDASRALLLAYERLDGAWRTSLNLDGDQKLVMAFLAGHGANTPPELARMTALPPDRTEAAIASLTDMGYVLVQRGSEERSLVTLTKRGLQARLRFEAVFEDLADTVESSTGDLTVACAVMLEARAVFDRHTEVTETES